MWSASSYFRKRVIVTVSAICRKRNDTAVGQSAGPQWRHCRRDPTAFPSRTVRWRNLPRVAVSPQLPACLLLRPFGAARPRNQSVACSTAIGNLPPPVRQTTAWTVRFQLPDPEVSAHGLLPAWVLRAVLPECCRSPTRPSDVPPLFSSVQPLRHLFPFHNRWYLHQLLKQRAVMNHRRSQIFRTCSIVPNPESNLVRRPVILHHSGMVDGNVGRTLIEIGYGITTSFHQRGHQVIGFSDRPLWGIDEPRLYGPPLFRKTFAFHRVKIANVELFNPLLAIR